MQVSITSSLMTLDLQHKRNRYAVIWLRKLTELQYPYRYAVAKSAGQRYKKINDQSFNMHYRVAVSVL